MYPSIIEHDEFDDDLKEHPIGSGSDLMVNLKKRIGEGNCSISELSTNSELFDQGNKETSQKRRKQKKVKQLLFVIIADEVLG